MHEHITSTANAYIKELKALQTKKGRVRQGRFLAEGDKCAVEALAWAEVEALLYTEGAELPADAQNVRCICVSEAVMHAVCDAKTPQNLAAVVRRPAPAALDCAPGLYAALENVADPQNVGTIIRTADAAGARAVLLSAGCADYTSPKAVRAAMGSVFHLPIVVTDDLPAALGRLRQAGVLVVAGHLCGREGFPHAASTCVLVGNEARGLSEAATGAADALCRIPIYGRAESLNAAVAAGILLYRAAEGMRD